MPRTLKVWIAALAALTAPTAARAGTRLAAPPAAPVAAPPAEPAAAPAAPTFRAARVEIVGFHEAAVLSALRLRLPRLPIDRHGGPPPAESPHVYVQIARTSDTTGALRVITSDGRAYEREFAVEIGQEVRTAASTAASLLFAVEEGTVAPDREDVAIPPPVDAPPTDTPPVDTPPTDTPPVDAPPAEPVDPPREPGPKEHAQKDMSPPPPPRWELGVALHGAAALGLGPPVYADALAGGGGGLGLELRARGGGLMALELRGLGRAETGLGVGRARVAVAGGYSLRRGRFELPVLLALSVEPWGTTLSGAGAAVFDGASRAARPPLLGGHLRVTPSARVTLPGGVGLRVGPRVELGGAFVVRDGRAQVVGLADTDGRERFRLGGLELSLGLELALQFGLRGASAAGRRAPALTGTRSR